MENKRITLTVIMAALAVVISYGQTEFDNKLKSLYKNTVPLIHSQELSVGLAADEKIILLDTRSYEEFQVSHLPNALFLDYDTFSAKEIEGINRSRKIVVYCSVGYRSERIGEKLIKMGFTDVRNLYGGIFDWVNHKNTVVNQAGVKTDSVHTYNRDWSRWLTRGVKVYQNEKETPAKSTSLLIIFYRNPEIGKVKTRLAATMGDASALAIYLYIAAHTKTIAENIPVDKAVHYSGYIDTEDNWPNAAYKKYLQIGVDLGERMSNAFKQGFQSGYQSVCIIGTDCYELTRSMIEEAFVRLQSHDVVIGPARDGGYYLLGMKKHYPVFFKEKRWSTDAVFAATIEDIRNLDLKYFVLPTLTDVDEEKDLPEELRKLN